ncbi:hypothetical protein TraAM80_10475 [Trypanosoma rangeli]|uniref:Uncharacterized protein n=1 Tax=Trypanosoma rangeli TaxID=5698 RepID=A0A422MP25_TRYRA|nr:uncharacterized protein TraAM80_10475 [Trypanosoma rangeli]RNE94964.1 hypothetical protein TraAM80_10475 [Trypanosoma rangeli]|eukprot:RNE94964.1 hypothetical protein TraAM80_10475 [Trypanosoma rangeli]
MSGALGKRVGAPRTVRGFSSAWPARTLPGRVSPPPYAPLRTGRLGLGVRLTPRGAPAALRLPNSPYHPKNFLKKNGEPKPLAYRCRGEKMAKRKRERLPQPFAPRSSATQSAPSYPLIRLDPKSTSTHTNPRENGIVVSFET